MTEKTKTKSQEVAADVMALIRARNPLIWIVTKEEARVERYLFEIGMACKYVPRTWDIAAGARDLGRKAFGTEALRDPGEMLKMILLRATGSPKELEAAQMTNVEPGMWVMRDLPTWLDGVPGAVTLRQLRNLVRELPGTPVDRAQVVIILSPSGNIPDELSAHAMVIEWPLPDRKEIAGILTGALSAYKPEIRAAMLPDTDRDAAIDAAVGLTGEEAAACYAKSIVQLRRVDPLAVAQEKKRVIAREGLLKWSDPLPGGIDAVGGLELLKDWLVLRKTAYSPEARAYGLQLPKGMFLVGVSGGGKTLLAKAAATVLSCPLLRFDLGALKSKFVGESEVKFRRALRVVESVGRCVVLIDEIEKGLQGATSDSADGGVSADALGAFLTWMQERTNEAFVVATANNIEGLPPELYRKGRFDELWFVDLPSKEERIAVLAAAIRSHGRDPKKLKVNLHQVATRSNGFTGAEIAALVPEAMFAAFNDGAREITTLDLLAVAETVTPLSKTAEEKLAKLRKWAKGRARPATLARPDSDAKQIASDNEGVRVLDLEEQT